MAQMNFGAPQNSAPIKLFLPRGDAKILRTAEISNWTGKSAAAPRTELDEFTNKPDFPFCKSKQN
jgi:hypothetical protein